MATTYGYAGEFSSDEDVDQQAQQRLNDQADPFNQLKPSKEEINEILETIRNVSPDKNVDFPDDTLAALLDHFKIQRGPIVDSTRSLYKKIALRAIRGNLHSDATNGTSEPNNNSGYDVDDNNKQGVDVHSSDEDEPMPPVSSQESVDMVNGAINPEPMEVDLDLNKSNQIREIKPIEISSSSDSEADDETEESDNETTVLSKKIDSTALATDVPQPIASTPISKNLKTKQTPKIRAKSSVKPVISEVEEKKHFTRSRRSGSASQKSNLSSSDTSAGTSLLVSEASAPKLDTSSRLATKQTKGQLDAGLSHQVCSFKTESFGKVSVIERPNESENIILVEGLRNGKNLNYAEKMVLNNLVRRRQDMDKLTHKLKSVVSYRE